MIKRNIDTELPEDINQAFYQLVIAGKHTMQELTDWLSERGYRFGKTTVNRYCIRIRGRVIGNNPLVGISPYTAFKCRKYTQELSDLLTRKTFIESRISAVKQIIFEEEAAYQADKQGVRP